MTAALAFLEPDDDAAAPVRLVDEDPALFAELPPEQRAAAGRRATAPVLQLPRGRWSAERPAGSELGLLVLDGLLVHGVLVQQVTRSEIVGPGDVLRPWQEEADVSSVPFASDWQVVNGARLAVLDARFAALAARHPALLTAVVERAVRRSHRLTLQLAIANVRRIEDRLMLVLWHLADRWGRVAPEGVTVPLPVTHEVLAQLVCAQRPTVTSALRRLCDDGRLQRRPDRTWLLTGDPPQPAYRIDLLRSASARS